MFGSKQTPWVWCCDCPKCLFVYTILSPFVKKEKLISVFGEDLFEKESLLKTFIELCGYGDIKPFECVGTFSEVRFCVNKVIEMTSDKELPYLLKYYKEHFELEKIDDNRLKYYNDENNLPIEFSKILKENINK